MTELAKANPGPGNDQTNNIEIAKEQTVQAKQRVAELEKFFIPVKGIPDTNKIDPRALAFAVRETVSQLRAAAQAKSTILYSVIGVLVSVSAVAIVTFVLGKL